MEKTVYWPSVQSFANHQKVAAAIVRACKVVEAEEIECSEMQGSFGNEHSIIDALGTITAEDKSNSEVMAGLGQSLYLVRMAGFGSLMAEPVVSDDDQDDAEPKAEKPKRSTRKKAAE